MSQRPLETVIDLTNKPLSHSLSQRARLHLPFEPASPYVIPAIMVDVEKVGDQNVEHLERTITQESGLSDQSRIDAFTPEEQKKIIWRIDCRLVLTLGFMYCVSLMDRTNLGIAAVAGMYTGTCVG